MKKMLDWKKMLGGALLAVGVYAGVQLDNTAEAAVPTNSIQPVQVEKGMTLSALAQQYGTNVKAWMYTNSLKSTLIRVGETLNPAFPYKVSKGDSMSYLAQRYNTTVQDIKNVNGLKRTHLYAGETIIIPTGKTTATHAVAPVVSKPVAVQAAPAATAHNASVVVPRTEQIAQPAPKSAPAVPSVPTVAGMAYKQQLNVVATAYGPDDIMWQFGGKTYTGTNIRQGVIAVDPNVIPLGSKVYVTGYHSPLLPAGGFVATAEDIGGAIKGNRIDVYINGTTAQLNQFGMQGVKVYVLK